MVMLGIVTPVKNESRNLRFLAQTVLSQTRRPDLWVIVDDGSTDDTPKLIKSLENNYNFITSLSLPTKHMKYDPIYRCGYVVRAGFEHILKICGNLGFFGILDADIVLKEDYYEKILAAFKQNSRIGVISGLYYVIFNKGRSIFKVERSDELVCGAMVFRKNCLLDIGGYPTYPSHDTTALIKAINRGWRLGIVTSTYAIHTRPSESWTKFLRAGLSRYILDLHPLSALFSGPLQALKNLSPAPLGFTIGYFMGMLYDLQKIEDEEINQYFHGRFRRSTYRIFKRIVERKRIETDPIKCSIIKLHI